MTTSMRILRQHLAIAALGASAIAGCGAEAGTLEEVNEIDQAVVDGDVISTWGTPSVALYHNTTRPCSGVYLGNRWVLTARHCVNNTTQSNLHVTSLLAPGPALPSSRPAPRWRTVTRIEYPSDANLDLALIKLNGDLANANGGTMAIATRANAASDLSGQELLCRGYGRAQNLSNAETAAGEATTGAGTLRQAWLPVTSVGATSVTMRRNDDGQILFSGDSGGPCFRLYASNGGAGISVGSISYGVSRPEIPPRYAYGTLVTRDRPYSSWIDQIILQ